MRVNLSADARTIAVDARLVGGQSTGDSTYWTCLLEAISKIEDRPPIRCYSDRPSPDLPFLRAFEWRHLPARNSRLWSLFQFPRATREDVVHAQYNLSPLVRRGISTIHDVSFLIGPQWFRPKDRVFLQRGIASTLRRAAAAITVSETSRKEIIRFYPSSAGKTFATPLACPAWIQRRLHPQPGIDPPYVLTVGTRWPRKNMELAVRAMDLVPPDIPHRLVVTGKAGWGDQELGRRGLATGYVSNERLSDLYSGADLYLAPSFHEGFGVPLLEAFRCGAPVMCSSGGALPEVAGDAAIVESSWDPGIWAARITDLLRDRSTLDSLRAKGFEREREFSWERCAMQTIAIYREVLG